MSLYAQYLLGLDPDPSGLKANTIPKKTLDTEIAIQERETESEIQDAFTVNPILAAYLQEKDRRTKDAEATREAILKQKKKRALEQYSAAELKKRLRGAIPPKILRGMSKDEIYAYMHDHRDIIPDAPPFLSHIPQVPPVYGVVPPPPPIPSTPFGAPLPGFAASPFDNMDKIPTPSNSPSPWDADPLIPGVSFPVSGPNRQLFLSPMQRLHPALVLPKPSSAWSPDAQLEHQLLMQLPVVNQHIPSINAQPPARIPIAPPLAHNPDDFDGDLDEKHNAPDVKGRASLSFLNQIQQGTPLRPTPARQKPATSSAGPMSITDSLRKAMKGIRKLVSPKRVKRARATEAQRLAQTGLKFSPPHATGRTRQGHGLFGIRNTRYGSGAKKLGYAPFGHIMEIDVARLKRNALRMRYVNKGYSIRGYAKEMPISKELSLLLQDMMRHREQGDKEWSNLDQYDHIMAICNPDDMTLALKIMTMAGLLKFKRSVIMEQNRMEKLKKIDIGEIQAGNNAPQLTKELSALKRHGY